MRVSLWKVGYIEYSVCLQHLTCARWRAAAVAATHKLIANSESELKMQGKCVWVSWMCVMLMWNLSSAATGHCQMRDWQSILFALSKELNFVTIYSWGDRDTHQELMWRNFNGFVCSLSQQRENGNLCWLLMFWNVGGFKVKKTCGEEQNPFFMRFRESRVRMELCMLSLRIHADSS